MIKGEEYVVFPDLESGKQKIIDNKKSENEYFSFGSDDLTEKKKGNTESKFDETISQGKQAVSKFGSLISNSFRNITKGRNEEPTIEKKEDEKGTMSDLKNLSSKIGKSLFVFGVISSAENC